MVSSLFKSAAAATAFLFGTLTLADLGKPVLFTDGLSPHVDSVFWTYLTPTQSTWDQWGWGWIPQRCFDEANNNNVSPYDIEVFNVHYTDCGSAFVFCRHHNAALSQIDMIDLFGRLPIHERQWIQHVMAVPGGGSAYESAAVVVFQGAVGVPSVFQHEVGHAVDAYQTNGGASGTSTFLNSINADSCVPDAYSNTNNVEDYTQVSVLALYEIVNPGGLDPIGNWRCLVNQKNAVDGFQKAAMTPGGTCDRRWADSAIISMGPATGNGKRAVVGPKPTTSLKAGAKDVFEIPFKQATPSHAYKNLLFNTTEKAAAIARQNAWAKKAQRSKRLDRYE